ncbi:hypothetical protein IB276_26155 [Ensifer sp. ENS04]|uniref:hypothetical protein n=1 Tax=Ensifer sp. ENS04 TaxID=2769281 RepID=UPI00177AFF00|nr:hypothetical protein [Ensifer sp. ENS04]MBD9542934.1 hypothetical protein [Ensifer sp. ENS04]
MTVVRTKKGPRIRVSPGTKGAISEHLATAFLLSSGYDVFRNVSPNGRADLLAVNWSKDETIRVDVKSEAFTLTKGEGGEMGAALRERDKLNCGFEIKYLVVKNNGDCGWYEDKSSEAANDNKEPKATWWRDRKTAQRFRMPDDCITNKQWSYFCHWVVRAYPDYIVPFSEEFVRGISSRGIGCDRPYISSKEIGVLQKLYAHIIGKLTELGDIDFIYEDAA